MVNDKKLDAQIKVVERYIQVYKDKHDLESALALAEAVDQLGETVDELLEHEEEANNLN